MSVLRLAIPSPLRTHFDYLPVADTDPSSLAPGTRITVPFGRRTVTAYLLEVVAETSVPADRLKRALQVLDEPGLLPQSLFQLCCWAAGYYQHPLGEVLPAAFPAALRRGRQIKAQGLTLWRLSSRGRGLPEGALGRSPRQAAAIALLQTRPSADPGALQAAGISAAVMRELQRKQLVEKFIEAATPPPYTGVSGLALNAEQAEAVQSISGQLEGFSCHLLEGVTGSGKTEVYLQLIDRCLRRGRQALVLIPEIGLTPQTQKRFVARFGERVAVLHSGLADGARQTAWEAARTGVAGVVLGTRSAIFVPLARPGIIVVDEEHDGSYKQQDGFRYSARDVAVKRGQLERVPVVLGSATPSLESLHNALQGRYRHAQITRRAGGGQLPDITALDVRKLPLQAGFSAALLEAIRQVLQRRQQVLLFLNRRGYAASLRCHDCGWIAGCEHCDARLSVHRRPPALRCHHCDAHHSLPKRCPDCHSPKLLTGGLGTEQVDEFLRQQFPDTPIFRVDSDSVQGRDGMVRLIEQVGQGGAGILVGTQMLTKGHHFPNVSLVAVLDADAALFSTDFRGEERMAQLLTQVAGRAGRADIPGRVLLQTHYPDHPAVRAILEEPYHQHACRLLEQRRLSGMPPAGYLVLFHAESRQAGPAEDFLAHLRQAVSDRVPATAQLVGPFPSPLQRRAGRFRSQLLVSAASRTMAQGLAAMLVERAGAQKLPADLRWFVDVDPQDVF